MDMCLKGITWPKGPRPSGTAEHTRKQMHHPASSPGQGRVGQGEADSPGITHRNALVCPCPPVLRGTSLLKSGEFTEQMSREVSKVYTRQKQIGRR